MGFSEKITEVQEQLKQHHVDGWLLYDFQKSNPLAHEFLELPIECNLTRRFFYWIPATGMPIKIVHEIEQRALDPWPGEKRVYLRWQTLEKTLKDLLKGLKIIAMEYSERCAVPYISKVDAGTMDLVKSCSVRVVSSAAFLQQYTSVLNEAQIRSLKEAAQVIEMALEEIWEAIRQALKEGKAITDCDVQNMILKMFAKNDCITNAPPHCAINANSADPHFAPNPKKPIQINLGDFILIDLWCKKNTSGAIFADVTRIGIAAKMPTDKQQEIFSIVRRAQKIATQFVSEKMASGKMIKGFEVDAVCRQVIEDAGYGAYFIHRTGHNITTSLHGPGTHFDSLETHDDRPVLKGTCTSCEPGIYLPGEFGLRLENDLLIDADGITHIIGGEQDKIVVLG